MEIVNDTQNKLLRGVLFVNALIGFAGYFVMDDSKAFIYGIIFGATIGFLNFRLLYLTLRRAVKMLPHQAQAYAASRYVIRYIITGIVLYVSIKSEGINTLGTLVGLFSIKLVILKSELFNSRQFFFNIFSRKEDK